MNFVRSLWGGGKKQAADEDERTDWPPITDADIEALLAEEAAGTDTWTEVKNENLIKVWKNKIKGSVYPVKAIFTLPKITADVAYQLMHNAPLRTEWDKFYVEYGTLGRYDDLNEYLYQAMKGPPGIQGRDFVLFRGVRADFDRNVFVLIFKNSSHPDRPRNATFVRATCIRSGYVIRPLPDDPSSCQMFVISQNDIAGSLPHWVINFVAPRGIVQWYNNFKRACEMLRARLEVLASEAAAQGKVIAKDATSIIESGAVEVHLGAKFESMDLDVSEDVRAADADEPSEE